MNPFSRRPSLRWAVPALAVAAVAGASSLAAVSASADPTLPDRTPAQLLADIQGATLHAGSGTVVQTSDLGLPQLPGVSADAGGAALTSVLTGTHTWRVWYAGPTKVRVALVGSLGETDVIRNGPDAWLWDSAKKSAVHYRMPAGEAGLPGPVPGAVSSHLPATPEQAAAAALAAVEPTTTVTTDKNVVVAGRPAYELVLTPKSTGSLVESVRIAVDGATYLPLRVRVDSTKRADPAFEVGFTQVSFDTPEDRQFDFTAPPGTTVSEGQAGSLLPDAPDTATPVPTPSAPLAAPRAPSAAPPAPPAPSAAPPAPPPSAGASMRPRVVGTGWSAVAVVSLPVPASPDTPAGTPAPGTDRPAPSGDPMGALLGALPRVSGAWGSGRLFEGTLVSAVLTDDGRLAVGAVGPDLLYAALAAP
ncbi:MAG: hypothetical protein V9F82_14545 [Dermatophilaceae bacterium]